MKEPEPNFNEVVELIVKEDDRYTKGGYSFLRKALDFTIDKERKRQGKVVTRKQRHVTGQELLVGIKEYALDQYGPMAYTLLTSWGVLRCEDIGEMVFNLIEYGIFSKNDDDSREDFSSIFTFEEAFVKPFQPSRRRLKRPRYKVIESL
ncbi:MAG: Minf_1886 family protein [Verrucomicrobiota bacterium]